MTHGSNQHTPQVYHHNQHIDESEMMMEEDNFLQVSL